MFLHIGHACYMIAIMLCPFIDLLEDTPARTLHVAANEMVVDRGETVVSLFIVKSGMVHLLRFQENGDAVVLQRAGEGAVVAEASVFAETYHCAVVAVQASRLLVYPMAKVGALLAQNPNAALAYSRHLAGEVREARKRAEILALKTVSARLSAWLTWNHGLLPARGTWHHVADEIGISKEALYRELSKRRQQKE